MLQSTPSRSPLQELLADLGLSVRDLAEALGLTYQQVWNALHGQQSLPHKADAALRELGRDPDDLRTRQAAWVELRASLRRAEITGQVNGALA